MDAGVFANWVSAIATAGAAGVALYIPFRMDRPQRERTQDAEKGALSEICFSVDQIVLHYLRVREAVLAADARQQQTRFRQIAVECTAMAGALGRMLNRDGLTDGPLIAGTAAIDLAEAVSVAAMMAADQKPENASVR